MAVKRLKSIEGAFRNVLCDFLFDVSTVTCSNGLPLTVTLSVFHTVLVTFTHRRLLIQFSGVLLRRRIHVDIWISRAEYSHTSFKITCNSH